MGERAKRRETNKQSNNISREGGGERGHGWLDCSYLGWGEIHCWLALAPGLGQPSTSGSNRGARTTSVWFSELSISSVAGGQLSHPLCSHTLQNSFGLQGVGRSVPTFLSKGKGNLCRRLPFRVGIPMALPPTPTPLSSSRILLLRYGVCSTDKLSPMTTTSQT